MTPENQDETLIFMEIGIKFGLFIVGLLGGIWIGRADVYTEWKYQRMKEEAMWGEIFPELNERIRNEGGESYGKEKGGSEKGSR